MRRQRSRVCLFVGRVRAHHLLLASTTTTTRSLVHRARCDGLGSRRERRSRDSQRSTTTEPSTFLATKRVFFNGRYRDALFGVPAEPFGVDHVGVILQSRVLFLALAPLLRRLLLESFDDEKQVTHRVVKKKTHTHARRIPSFASIVDRTTRDAIEIHNRDRLIRATQQNAREGRFLWDRATSVAWTPFA